MKAPLIKYNLRQIKKWINESPYFMALNKYYENGKYEYVVDLFDGYRYTEFKGDTFEQAVTKAINYKPFPIK